MPATSADYGYIRYDLDTDSTVMPDSEIDTLFTRAEAIYGVGASATVYVRILAIRRLKAGAAKRVDYKQNQSQEWLSQLYKNLEMLEKQFQDDLDTVLANSIGVVRFGGLRRFQPRLEEWPDNQEPVLDDSSDVSRLDQ